MAFLSPFLLACAAALAVPLWLHLRRKRRQTPVEFPSLRYLKLATARMQRQVRVEDLSLLLLRLLLLALLALAFARPVVRSTSHWLGAQRRVESVVVIDATTSMGWRGPDGTRLDAAKQLARQWISGLDGADAVALWVLTDKLEPVVPVPITDRAQVFRMLDAITPTEGSSSLAPVFTAAREWAATGSLSRKELLIITDNQAAAWDWPADEFFRHSWQRSHTSLAVLAPDELRASNISVAAIEWDQAALREGAMLTGTARLVNCGDAAASDLLECRIGGQTVLRKPVALAAGGSLELPLALPVPALDACVLTGEVALAGDALACDDRWCFALPLHRAFHAMVVEHNGGIGGGMRAGFFLTKALTAGGAGKVQAIEADAWAKQATEGVDAVWFTGGAVAGADAWEKALAFAATGGTVVVTADAPPDPLPKAWPVSAGEEVSLPAGRIATRLLVPKHPLFSGLWSEQTPFPPLPQKTLRRCMPAAAGKVLATLAGEFPLLVEVPHGMGRVLWLNASADRAWGDLPLSPAFVPLVQQLANARQLAMQTSSACWVGEAWPDLTKFAGSAAWPAAADGSAATRALHSGVYDAVTNSGQVEWSCAVNVRRAESDLRPLEAAKLQAMLPGRVATGSQGLREWREASRREVPLWPWLLGSAALVFLAEGWVSAAAAKRRIAAAGGAESPTGQARRMKSIVRIVRDKFYH
ncbi:MAG: VWA domain-containing protein [Verrucomicrobia bacterium]|nr:MAG: VWA domain-containing protein [Verrucomicrobiota bacterium]